MAGCEGRATRACADGPDTTQAILYSDYMKAIQVTLDDDLLARLDRDEEVRRDGRSAVLRRAADLYLRKRRAGAIASAYRRAYGDGGGAADFEGWEKEGVWPGE